MPAEWTETHQDDEQMPALIPFPLAIGLWVLAAMFFNNPAGGAVDVLWWHPVFVKMIAKALPLCSV